MAFMLMHLFTAVMFVDFAVSVLQSLVNVETFNHHFICIVICVKLSIYTILEE